MNKIKAFFIAIVLLAVVFAVLAGVKANQIVMMIESGEQFVPPPESVSTTVVERQSWSNYFDVLYPSELDFLRIQSKRKRNCDIGIDGGIA